MSGLTEVGPHERALRQIALDRALEHHGKPNEVPHDAVLRTAAAFYEFLKDGTTESKES